MTFTRDCYSARVETDRQTDKKQFSSGCHRCAAHLGNARGAAQRSEISTIEGSQMPGLIVIRLHHADPKLVTLDTPPELAPTMGKFQPARYSPIRGGSYVMPIEQVENLTVFARFNGLAVSDERHTAPAGARIVGAPRPSPQCSNCGQPAKRGREPTYCPQCGNAWDPIEYAEEAASIALVQCPDCRELQRPGFPKCMHCGQPLPEDNPTAEHDADDEAQPTTQQQRTRLDEPLPLAVTLDELHEQQTRRAPPAKP